MRIFITGANGQLGYDVMRELAKRQANLNVRNVSGIDVSCENKTTDEIVVIGSDVQEDSLYAKEQCRTKQCKVQNAECKVQSAKCKVRNVKCIMYNVEDIAKDTNLHYVQLDITDREAVLRTIREIKPDAVIHCAAWTAVDLAEDNEEKVRAINVDGTQNIADACKEIDAKMLYISTDYVFDGQGTKPWKADCKDFAPLNVYGQSKLDGEFAVAKTLKKYFIVRIAWVFGANGNNFVKTMLKVGKTHDEVRVVNDQIGTPTYTPDLAKLLADMIATDKYGFYHATNEGGYISWYDFACEIYHQAGYSTKVIPVTTEEYGLSKAKRPFNSRLDKSKLEENGFERLPEWKNALKRYLEIINDNY